MTVVDGVEQTGSVSGRRPVEGLPVELVDQLMAKVKAEGLELLGDGGVLTSLN